MCTPSLQHTSPSMTPHKTVFISSDENTDSSTESDTSSGLEWLGPENQLGLPQEDLLKMERNLDKEGEIKHHEGAAKY